MTPAIHGNHPPTHGRYVCDVNGWSFVKDSQKFWDDSANLIRNLVLESIAPLHLERCPIGYNAALQARACLS